MPTGEAAEALSEALRRVAQGETRTRPVSVSLPGPLADALQQLAESGLVPSTSAAAAEALTQWAYNKLLRLALDELYEQQPDLRPTRDQVRAMAERLGVPLPQVTDQVA